jgi:hypothetical protein
VFDLWVSLKAVAWLDFVGMVHVLRLHVALWSDQALVAFMHVVEAGLVPVGSGLTESPYLLLEYFLFDPDPIQVTSACGAP